MGDPSCLCSHPSSPPSLPNHQHIIYPSSDVSSIHIFNHLCYVYPLGQPRLLSAFLTIDPPVSFIHYSAISSSTSACIACVHLSSDYKWEPTFVSHSPSTIFRNCHPFIYPAFYHLSTSSSLLPTHLPYSDVIHLSPHLAPSSSTYVHNDHLPFCLFTLRFIYFTHSSVLTLSTFLCIIRYSSTSARYLSHFIHLYVFSIIYPLHPIHCQIFIHRAGCHFNLHSQPSFIIQIHCV